MSSSSANASSGGSSSLPRLGPAWQYRGDGNQGGRGFQPPPAVPAERRTRSGSQVSDHSNDSQQGRQQNKFSVLGDDDDNNWAPVSNSRSEGLRSAETRRSSSTGKPSGRSLADLAARAPAREAPGYPRKHASGDEGVGGRFAGLKSDGGEGKVIRYTREKLLSMRPQPKSAPPEVLRHLEGTPILSKTPQDPVCWDTFDADEIWAQAARERSLRNAAKGVSSGPSIGLGTLADRSEGRRGSGGPPGRWQRGVALPPPGETRARSASRGSEGDTGDLWDDPVGGATGAASDFSAFGAIPDDSEKGSTGAFDFSEMAKASQRFDEELHGGSRGEGGASDGEDAAEVTHSVPVDPRRPLAAAGTTIRSGSGDDVNVFEDFDENEGAEGEAAPEAVKSADENPTDSSRLMKMIGVTKETGTVSAWGSAADTAEAQSSAGAVNSVSSAIPSNPWGGPMIPVGGAQSGEGLGLSSRLEAAMAEQKAREAQVAAEMEKRRQLQESEMMRRREEEEAQRRAALVAQQKAQAQQQAEMQQQAGGGHSQVELVLIERISTILENNWGRSEPMAILSKLHSEDPRVVPLLGNVDALRALIARHPRRVGLRQDPASGAEIAVLILTNAQWQQHQQAQARAEQEEIQRRQEQERAQAMHAESEAARARAEAERAAAAQPIVPDAPWFYADPQNNIQGPFKGVEMRQWLEAGYFKGDLPISQQPSGPFRQLQLIFPDLSMAFQVAEPSPSVDETQARAAEEEKRLQKAAEDARVAEEKLRAEAAVKRQREEAAAAERDKNSTQLKMLLGLEGSASTEMQEGIGQTSISKEAVPQEPSSKQSSSRSQQPEKRSSAKQQSTKTTKPSQRTETKPPTLANAPAAPATTPSAWGAAATAAPRRKSMSEIQQEEARKAAILAMERKSAPRQSSSGWANVAASGGGGTGWSGGAVKTAAPAVVTNAQVPVVQTRTKQQPTQVAAQRQAVPSQQQQSTASKAVDDFGAEGRMSPSLETWCKEQMQKLNGSDDLTLVSFCMTLTDGEEIRQYLTAYLGSTPQVNSFAAEFINRKDRKKIQDEWETPANVKKGRKKKGAK